MSSRRVTRFTRDTRHDQKARTPVVGHPRPMDGRGTATVRRPVTPPGTTREPNGHRARGPARTSTQRTSGRRPAEETQRLVQQRPLPTPRDWRRRLRIVAVIASALVLVLTGTAWGLYRDVTAGLTTTDVIGGANADGADNILLVGVDSRTDAKGNPLPQNVLDQLHAGPDTGVLNSDTIIVLHVPDGGGSASAFSVPRDSYVDIPGYRRDKINAAYPAMKALTAQRLVAEGVHDPAEIDRQSSQAGRTALVKSVENVTGLAIDHYAEINLLGFANLTEAVGGVNVCLRAATSDELSGANFAAGPTTLTGANALSFVRQRHGLPEGDLSRIRRQQVFLAAVAKKILSAGTLTDPARLSALLGVAEQSVVIDSGWDLLSFAHKAADIAAGNLQFVTIPTQGNAVNERGDVVMVDPDAVRSFIEQSDEAQAAAAEQAAKAKPLPPPPGPVQVIANRYVVDVGNGSGMNGLASAVSGQLRGLGFIRGRVENTDPIDESVVGYTGADEMAARSVAEQLGGIAVERTGDTVAGHLQVRIGADFNPEVVPAPAPEAPAGGPAAPPNEPITAAGVPCVN